MTVLDTEHLSIRRSRTDAFFEMAPFPSADATHRSHPISVVLIAIAFVALAITSRVGMIAWPFLNDSGLYAQLGRTVAQGGVLYRDFYETKLPGAALIASVFWRMFGPHWAGYVLCQLFLAIVAAVALARSARQHLGNLATWPVFLFAIVFLNLSQLVYTGFQLETLQAFFEDIAAMSAMRSLHNDDGLSSFTAGLAAGMAAMPKPGGFCVAVALLGATVIFSNRRLLHSCLILLGAAIPTAVTAIYTVKTGASQYLPAAMHDIAAYASGTPVNSDALLKLLVVLLIFGWPFAVRLFGCRPNLAGSASLRTFVLAWLMLDLIAVLLQRRLYPYHFLPLVCPLAILYGMLPGRVSFGSFAVGLLPIALLSLTWEGSSPLHVKRGSTHLPVSDFIASHTNANDTVFADQIGRLLIETDRQPGCRLGTFFYMVNADDSPAKYAEIFLRDFDDRKPKYLVLPKDWDQPEPGLANCDILKHCPQRRANFVRAWRQFRSGVAWKYHLETSIGASMVYRRN